jgi:hypothetical protein
MAGSVENREQENQGEFSAILLTLTLMKKRFTSTFTFYRLKTAGMDE